MAEYVGLQQPPSKRIRLTGNGSESDFDFKMLSPFGTSDVNSNVDSFDPGSDFTDPLDNTNANSQKSNPVPNHYQSQMQLNYSATTNGPMSMYQNPQCMINMSNPNSARQVNGTPQTVMYQQQQTNSTARPIYSRPTTNQIQSTSSTLTQGNYTPSGMVPVPNVPQTNIVKASDPNNNHVFVNYTPTGIQPPMQQHQQGSLISLPNQHTVMPTNKQNGLPSLNTQQFNTYQTQRPQVANSFHVYNVRAPTIDQPTNNSSTYQMRPQIQQVSTMPGSHNVTTTPVSNNSTTNGAGGTTGIQSSENQRKQFIQRQLVLLLHSHKCQQREKQLSTNGDPTRSTSCTLPHCATMKNVLQHMARCNDHKNCPVPHCVTSRQIIFHWKQCVNVECPICQPLKSSPSSNNPTVSTAPPNKEWQRRVTQDMRSHLVQKIINALFPIGNDTSMLRDTRIINLNNYARRVESDTFDVATNQEEYFHKLAEKIYRIQKELQERREKKRIHDHQSSENGVSTSIGAFGGTDRIATIDGMSGASGPPNRVAPSTDVMSKPVFPRGGSTVLPNLFERSTSSSTNSNQTLMGTQNMPLNVSVSSLLTHDVSISGTPSDGGNRIGQAGFTMKVEATSSTASAQVSLVTVKKEDTSTSAIDASNTTLPKHPVYFSREELCIHLQPVIDEMLKHEESIPFQQPVDPVALNILDYPKIIKHPMDISTIQKKLNEGEYENPLKFSDDARLMFNNAWTYNRKTTRIYRMCTKLSEVFTAAFDQAAQRLGYCCGHQYVYFPQVMFCYGNQLCCQIPRDGSYYYYNNTDPSRFNLSGDKYTFCAKCFDSVKGETIAVGDDPAQTLIRLPKNEFSTAKNDNQEPETTIDCTICTRRWHQVCALHFDHIWPEGFVCPTCVKQYNIRRKDNRFIASRLCITNLAACLEQRVNEFLRHEKGPIGRVTIRVLAASDKICEVKPRLKKYCGNQVPNGYPYRAKAIFAFQEIEGADVVLFGMYVQEYDGRAPAPNSRRVYISYLDSVHFFRPKHLRTDVYHEILIGYLDYVKKLGYLYAHIWACPPSEGDDYIFHCHPADQRVPKAKRLQDWYKKMLDRALLERVIVEYKDVREDCLDNQVQNVWNIPYFEGDFWANIIEESIKELDQEEEDRRQQELESARAVEDIHLDESFQTEDPSEISDKRRSASIHKKKHLKKTASSQRKVAKKQMSNCTDLISKIFSTMDKHKEAFFVIRLQETGVSLPTISDNDALIQCDLMDTRDAFLNFARDKHYEFSSIRRAKFSTLALLYELHTAANEKFTYTCNTCRQQCEIRYHCTECEDYDLCEKCYNTEPKHKHKMERSTPGMVDDGDQSSSQGNGKSSISSQLQRQQSMQRCIEALIHAVNCRNANCFNRSCFRYKRVILHTNECKCKSNQCNICKQVIFLCWYHAKTCVDPNCQVPFCTNLKSKIQKQRATSLQTDRRRMQAMMEQRSEVKVSAHSSTSGHSNALRSDASQAASYESTSMANASGKSAVRLVSPSQTPNRSIVPSSNTSYIVAQKPNSEKLSTYHSGSTVVNSLAATVARIKQDPTTDEAQLVDQNGQKQAMFSPLINKALVTQVSSNTFNQLQTQTHSQPQQQQWYGANTAQNYPQSANHGMTIRPRYPPVSHQNSSMLQSLIAPTRATLSPSGYTNRPTLTLPSLTLNQARPPSTQPQDPNPR